MLNIFFQTDDVIKIFAVFINFGDFHFDFVVFVFACPTVFNRIWIYLGGFGNGKETLRNETRIVRRKIFQRIFKSNIVGSVFNFGRNIYRAFGWAFGCACDSVKITGVGVLINERDPVTCIFTVIGFQIGKQFFRAGEGCRIRRVLEARYI